LSTMDEGSEILFQTKHSVFAAPYHTNVKGNLRGTAFFMTQDPQQALKIAQELGADLVLLPPELRAMYHHQGGTVVFDQDGEEVLSEQATFAEQLEAGRIPDWLEPVRLPFLQGYKIFEIKKDETQLPS
ncbi:MAG: hypothetical protein AB7E52_01620, partial [Bdellovibrionales bacterium]